MTALSGLVGAVLSLLIGLLASWASARQGAEMPWLALASYGGVGGMLGHLSGRGLRWVVLRLLGPGATLGGFLIQIVFSLTVSTICGATGLVLLGSSRSHLVLAVIGLAIGVFAGGMGSALQGLLRASERSGSPSERQTDPPRQAGSPGTGSPGNP